MTKLKLRSNKGFTMQDLIIAIIIFTIFAGTICSLFVIIFNTQADTQVDEIAALYAVQIAEYIDRIDYDRVTNEISSVITKELDISENYTLNIDVSEYRPQNETETYMKIVKIILTYNFKQEDKNLTIEKLKIKEIL